MQQFLHHPLQVFLVFLAQIAQALGTQMVISSFMSRFVAASAVALACFAGMVSPALVHAKAPPPVLGNAAAIALADLPKQGKETYEQILKGGPFAYDKDGTVFGNRERLLPAEKRGFYREYTVKTPYARNRGAKRIVCGGLKPSAPEACYYTEDHYASFKRIAP
jgi:ribonuclease T1